MLANSNAMLQTRNYFHHKFGNSGIFGNIVELNIDERDGHGGNQGIAVALKSIDFVAQQTTQAQTQANRNRKQLISGQWIKCALGVILAQLLAPRISPIFRSCRTIDPNPVPNVRRRSVTDCQIPFPPWLEILRPDVSRHGRGLLRRAAR